MKFKDIPQFTSWGNYQVTHYLKRLSSIIKYYKEDYGLILNPDFQRGHVWTKKQQSAYIEFFLKGGKTGNIIFFNDPNWQGEINKKYKDFVLVDGLQRITALLDFLDNKVKAFNCYYQEYKDEMIGTRYPLQFNINNLQSKVEVLQWYLDLNSGGVIHSEQEISRVRLLLLQEERK